MVALARISRSHDIVVAVTADVMVGKRLDKSDEEVVRCFKRPLAQWPHTFHILPGLILCCP